MIRPKQCCNHLRHVHWMRRCWHQCAILVSFHLKREWRWQTSLRDVMRSHRQVRSPGMGHLGPRPSENNSSSDEDDLMEQQLPRGCGGGWYLARPSLRRRQASLQERVLLQRRVGTATANRTGMLLCQSKSLSLMQRSWSDSWFLPHRQMLIVITSLCNRPGSHRIT